MRNTTSLNKFLFLLLCTFSCLINSCSCGKVGNYIKSPIEATEEKFNFESIIDETGTVITKAGDSVRRYEHAIIIYSESNILLIKTIQGKYVYIHGPVVVELDSLKAYP